MAALVELAIPHYVSKSIFTVTKIGSESIFRSHLKILAVGRSPAAPPPRLRYGKASLTSPFYALPPSSAFWSLLCPPFSIGIRLGLYPPSPTGLSTALHILPSCTCSAIYTSYQTPRTPLSPCSPPWPVSQIRATPDFFRMTRRHGCPFGDFS